MKGKRDNVAAALMLTAALLTSVSPVSIALEAGDAAAVIVARVNDESIPVAEVHRVIADLADLYGIQGISIADLDRDDLEQQAIHMLVQRQLLLQEADRRRFEVTDDELDAAIIELRGRFEDLESFGEWMNARGLDDQSLFDTIRADILVQKVTTELSAGATIEAEAIDTYWAAHRDDLIIGEEVRLGMIVVSAAAMASDVVAALRTGRFFDEMARDYSSLPDTYTSWLDPQSLPLPVQEAISGLEEGDVYGPIMRSDDEFVVVGLAARRPVFATSIEDARNEIERRLRPVSERQVVSNWLARQELTAEIDIYLDRS